MTSGRIRIGIGGWTYAPWRGSFYPDKLPQAKELEYAASQLSAIEINATFYSRQSPKSWEKWGNSVPDGFRFAIKGSRFCVMRSKLAEGAEGIGNFFAQGFAALGEYWTSRNRYGDCVGSIEAALRKADGSFDTTPEPDTPIEVGDVLIGVGTPDEIRALEDLFSPSQTVAG